MSEQEIVTKAKPYIFCPNCDGDDVASIDRDLNAEPLIVIDGHELVYDAADSWVVMKGRITGRGELFVND